MAVFRIEKTKNYTVMSNYHLRDRELSIKGKGLLSLMLSLPENWNYTLSGLAVICKDGIGSIRSAVAEIEERGYLTRRRIREANGQLGDIEYTILEVPQKPVNNDVDMTASGTDYFLNESYPEIIQKKGQPNMKNRTAANQRPQILTLTLCHKCKTNFENSGYIVIHKGWQEHEERCDYCNIGRGVTYAIFNRKESL